ncbi:MAG: alpha/beta fold hydrolase [Cyclobacteriaceae bacterium]
MNLFYREAGEGQPMIILHGLFGSSDNWFTLSKTFAGHYRVFTVDQRNHGQSPHTDDFNYRLLTDDLAAFVARHQLQRPILLGHSMGGKTVMNFAIKNPDQLSAAVVVDIAPKAYSVQHDHILEGLEAIPLGSLGSRQEADRILAQNVSEADVRQFLLKNLNRTADGFSWRVNLKAIDRHMNEIVADLQYPGQYTGPCLFVKGSRSNYFAEGDDDVIRSRFTHAEFATLDTGHWVQAERPREFAEVVLDFLKRL